MFDAAALRPSGEASGMIEARLGAEEGNRPVVGPAGAQAEIDVKSRRLRREGGGGVGGGGGQGCQRRNAGA